MLYSINRFQLPEKDTHIKKKKHTQAKKGKLPTVEKFAKRNKDGSV